MTPAARVQAAIELLDEIVVAARDAGAAADTIIQSGFKRRRYAGSKDRKSIRDLVYRAIRTFGDRPANGRAAMLGLATEDPDLALLFDGSPYAPAPRSPGEPVAAGAPIPAWLTAHLEPSVGDLDSLLERAPLDIRVNSLKASRDDVLAALAEGHPTPHAPLGIRLPEGYPVEKHKLWNMGQVEVQDEGSQLISLAADVRPGLNIVDLCAGAGGKTLAVAAETAGAGRIVACDVNRARLAKLPPRAERAGARNIETRLLNPEREREALADLMGLADRVVVDAPCSGSGTWRRNPETRWRLTPDRLDQLLKIQAYLLELAVDLLRPGGRLIYAVCSVLADEGRGQADEFSRRYSSFQPIEPPFAAGQDCGHGRLLSPGRDGTDGFFVASWRAPC